MPTPRCLDDIVKLDALSRESPGRIRAIWAEAHAQPQRPLVAAVLSAAEHDALNELAALSPLFPLPVSRGLGAFETFLAQHQGRHTLFTTVDEYTRRPGGAQAHLVLTRYDELLASHSLVLLRGEAVGPSLGRAEAAALLDKLLLFYARGGEAERAAVTAFGRGDAAFSFDAVLAACGVTVPTPAPAGIATSG